MSACFVIPAAGRGSRLGADAPKILVRVTEHATVWSLLRDRVRGLADHVHLVLSPHGKAAFEAEAADDLRDGRVSLSVQPEPRGMGDAIFGARERWSHFEHLLVLWGDQLGIARATLRAVVEAQTSPSPGEARAGSPARGVEEDQGRGRPCLTLPLVRMQRPYVQYQFDSGGALRRVLQSREGDRCDPEGWSDVGLFGLSTHGLAEAWDEYSHRARPGEQTGEANFLPFLSFLSTEQAWPVRRVTVADPLEARGVNTQDDLAFFRARLEENG